MGCVRRLNGTTGFLSRPAYRCALRDSPGSYLEYAAAQWVKDRGAKRVLDLGCGPARILEALCDSSHGFRVEQYLGVDFAPGALATGAARGVSLGLPCSWVAVDLDISASQEVVSALASVADVVLCLETLEHIEGDLVLLGALPKGSPVFATVPSFDDPGHVRYFSSLGEVDRRYASLFEGYRSWELGNLSSMHHFAFVGVRGRDGS